MNGIQDKIIINCINHYIRPPWREEVRGRGKYTLTSPHPDPLHQAEREFLPRERVLYEIVWKTMSCPAKG